MFSLGLVMVLRPLRPKQAVAKPITTEMCPCNISGDITPESDGTVAALLIAESREGETHTGG